MKKTNKGFSLVELIIVIAIMAILAGALAPALIKYINKSRVSTDIQTAQTVATAVTTALSIEKAYEACNSFSGKDVRSMTGTDSFTKEFVSALGTSAANIKGKAKKGLDGSTTLNGTIYLTVDPVNNVVKVYVGGTTAAHEAYPTVGTALQE